MKRRTFASLALIGIQCGCLLAGTSTEELSEMPFEMYFFYNLLDEKGKQQFLELDEEHRRAAMSAEGQHCHSRHQCRGLREASVENQHNHQNGGKK